MYFQKKIKDCEISRSIILKKGNKKGVKTPKFTITQVESIGGLVMFIKASCFHIHANVLCYSLYIIK